MWMEVLEVCILVLGAFCEVLRRWIGEGARPALFKAFALYAHISWRDDMSASFLGRLTQSCYCIIHIH